MKGIRTSICYEAGTGESIKAIDQCSLSSDKTIITSRM